MRREFYISMGMIIALTNLSAYFSVQLFWLNAVWLPILILGIHDVLQKKHTILRNFPVIGHFRYLLETIRPEINQYFVESNHSGVPFSREQRSIVYQRSKGVLDTLPFGTQMDTYAVGYECFKHSLLPLNEHDVNEVRVTIGADRKKPYSASIFNISAMSFGALSKNAILSLNAGAKAGNFAHNTGEGGLSQYHLAPGGDIIWQIGTGYFGCRTHDGKFDEEKFKAKANIEQVRMIEIKLSQGAKPGHGGILPASKITQEISDIRNVPFGRDVLSPPGHTAFCGFNGLIDFIEKLRELSGGKPIGIKLCLGKLKEFTSLIKLMKTRNSYPDFITIDGGEGGTGAAPLEFSNHLGMPLVEALVFIGNILRGYGLKEKIKVGVSGKILTAFDILKFISIGADYCNSARGMMLALGCIQALRCNSNDCPTGVATQKSSLVKGLVVEEKYKRIKTYHEGTIDAVKEMLAALGMKDTHGLGPQHLMRRTSEGNFKSYSEIYPFFQNNEFDSRDKISRLPKRYKDILDILEIEDSLVDGK